MDAPKRLARFAASILALTLVVASDAIAAPQISKVKPTILPLGRAVVVVGGTGFERGSIVFLNGQPLPTHGSGRRLSAVADVQPIPGFTAAIVVGNPDGTTSAAVPVPIEPKKPRVPFAGAVRFLEQATFGADPQNIAYVETQGFQPWLDAQLSAPASTYPARGPMDNNGPTQAAFFYNAINQPDQLRQRVAFALAQIFVVSINKLRADAMAAYLNTLQQEAFQNYRDVMNAVTLSPGMGVFLDMVNNNKANPKADTSPNENYARELMQLFTIGTVLLNPDGTPQLDNNHNPIPTYQQSDVADLARALTGWTYATQPGQTPLPHNPYYTGAPMIAYEGNHDNGAKTVLGQSIPAGQSTESDLKSALDIIFNHPNLGPFVSYRLIQHLVTSNPSTAYVQRVTQVFNDNGKGVRGDLVAVVRAILLDSEARAGDQASTLSPNGGHLREPVLLVTSVVRTLGGSVTTSNSLASVIAPTGQILLNPPSVFNYYSPFYRVDNGQLAGPEFQILTPSTAVLRANLLYALLLNGLNGNVNLNPAPFAAIASNSNALIQAVNNALDAGEMSSNTQGQIANAIAATKDPGQRALTALCLAATAGEFQVQQ